ncbi:hypothetical protein LC593_07890 [Nostoc sp. CHAB 5844]|nr:hypothetical protein [Nostoc sp. CHAB 5844]
MELVILSFWLMLMLFILRLAYFVLQTHQKTSRQYYPKKTSIHQHKDKTILSFLIPRPSSGRNIHHPQWRKLLRLVHGDVATANRLIDCERRKNPDRSLDWCIDKAIWQLQRDRR